MKHRQVSSVSHGIAKLMWVVLFLAGCGGDAPERDEEPHPVEHGAVADKPSDGANSQDLRRAELAPLFAQLERGDSRSDAYLRLSETLTKSDGRVLLEAFDATDNSSARWRLARLMGGAGATDTAGRLLEALQSDPSHYVRRNAAVALGLLGDRSAVEPLTEAMRHDADNSVHWSSAVAIDQILGADARPILERERRETKDSDLRGVLDSLLDPRSRETAEPTGVPGQIVDGCYEGTRYKLYLPRAYQPGQRIPLLVSVHGTNGSPDPYAAMWTADADRLGFAVLAPHFDYAKHPNYDLLGLDFLEVRSDKRLFDIVHQVSRNHLVQTVPFYLFGHSKGGQFVTRFVLAHPKRVARAVAAGPGNYVRWQPNVFFPTGTKPHPFAPDLTALDFGALVAHRLAVVLGDQELERRKIAAAEFMGDVARYGEEHGVTPTVELIWVPGGGHSGRSNQPAACQYLFER